jgi:uncharacterized lipoprotein YehR (DUF1307 family)
MTNKCERIIKHAALLLVLLAFAITARAADYKTGTYSVTADGVKYSIKYHDGNKVTVTRGGEVAVEGTYKVTGDEIEVTDESGPLACGGEEKTGRYKWKLEGKVLTLTKVQDGCTGRANALTAQSWTRE